MRTRAVVPAAALDDLLVRPSKPLLSSSGPALEGIDHLLHAAPPLLRGTT
jgi:hypothetical protein